MNELNPPKEFEESKKNESPPMQFIGLCPLSPVHDNCSPNCAWFYGHGYGCAIVMIAQKMKVQ